MVRTCSIFGSYYPRIWLGKKLRLIFNSFLLKLINLTIYEISFVYKGKNLSGCY